MMKNAKKSCNGYIIKWSPAYISWVLVWHSFIFVRQLCSLRCYSMRVDTWIGCGKLEFVFLTIFISDKLLLVFNCSLCVTYYFINKLGSKHGWNEAQNSNEWQLYNACFCFQNLIFLTCFRLANSKTPLITPIIVFIF